MQNHQEYRMAKQDEFHIWALLRAQEDYLGIAQGNLAKSASSTHQQESAPNVRTTVTQRAC